MSQEKSITDIHYDAFMERTEPRMQWDANRLKRLAGIPEHDGKLDNVGTLTVKFEQLSKGQVVEISEDPKHWLWFSPQQALSLLAWLEQEKGRLEELAKEQAE